MNQQSSYAIEGVGLGLRRALLPELKEALPKSVDFMEVAPENWIGIGGKLGKDLKFLSDRYPMLCHGLSLSIGGPGPLNETLVRQIKSFLQEHQVRLYSEHLSYCSDDGQLYDLMPIPFTEEAVTYVAERVKRVQDILERTLILENVSYYAAPGQEMQEIDFIKAVLDEADCQLLLDVNNIYVNSVNHQYDAEKFLKALPAERIAYIHVAGHYNEADDLIVDTHGADVVDPVWQLLEMAYQHFGVVPTLLERDFNLPPLPELLEEVDKIHQFQKSYSQNDLQAAAQ